MIVNPQSADLIYRHAQRGTEHDVLPNTTIDSKRLLEALCWLWRDGAS